MFCTGLLIASAIFGIATATSKEVGKPFFRFFYSAAEIILIILGKLIWYSIVRRNLHTHC